MSDDFQPEKPHGRAPEPGRRPAAVWIALLSALGVIMVLAILSPRIIQESGLSWLITLGAGVAVFIVVWVVGRMKGAKSEQPRWHDEDKGEK